MKLDKLIREAVFRFDNLEVCSCKNGVPCTDTMFTIREFFKEELLKAKKSGMQTMADALIGEDEEEGIIKPRSLTVDDGAGIARNNLRAKQRKIRDKLLNKS